MTEVKVNSNICGFTHIIRGKMNGQDIIIDIDTPCKNIKNMSHLEVPMMDILDIKENIVMQKAREARCTSTCLVPCAVMHICFIEAGFMSDNLARKVGSISIDFV